MGNGAISLQPTGNIIVDMAKIVNKNPDKIEFRYGVRTIAHQATKLIQIEVDVPPPPVFNITVLPTYNTSIPIISPINITFTEISPVNITPNFTVLPVPPLHQPNLPMPPTILPHQPEPAKKQEQVDWRVSSVDSYGTLTIEFDQEMQNERSGFKIEAVNQETVAIRYLGLKVSTYEEPVDISNWRSKSFDGREL